MAKVRSSGAKGDREGAGTWVDKPEDIHGHFGRWWSLHGLLRPANDAPRSFALGVSFDPLEPPVACEEKILPDLPGDPIRAALCEAAGRAPRQAAHSSGARLFR